MWQQYTVLEDMQRLEFAHCPHRFRPFHDEAHHLCPGFRAQLGVASSDLRLRTRKRESSTRRVESNSPRSAIALRSEDKMTRRLQHSSFAPARCKITAAAGACQRSCKRSRVWSPDEVPLCLKSSVHGCQRYLLNRLFVQEKNTSVALGRSNTFLLNHVHDANSDATCVTVTSTIMMRETLPFAVRRAGAPMFPSMSCNGVSQGLRRLLRHRHLAWHYHGLPTTLNPCDNTTARK